MARPKKTAVRPTASSMIEQMWRLADNLENKRVTPQIANAISAQHRGILSTVKVVKSLHIRGGQPSTLLTFKG